MAVSAHATSPAPAAGGRPTKRQPFDQLITSIIQSGHSENRVNAHYSVLVCGLEITGQLRRVFPISGMQNKRWDIHFVTYYDLL